MEIRAFKGYRFNSQIVGDPGACASPPYDVIDKQLTDDLYAKSDHNVVRIIKGKTTPADTEQQNQYTRARDFLNNWIKSEALKQDTKETIYGYVQDFEIAGERFERTGFVALGKLVEFGHGVQPHEKTLDGPKADRLKLMRANTAQLGQIFMLYDDPEQVADKVTAKAASVGALLDFVDDHGVRHRLYAIDEAKDVAAVTDMMATRQAVIADGHHRYETALNYYKETQNPAAQYRMMTFVNMRNEGLVILPTHRLVGNLAEFDIEALLGQIGDEFAIETFTFDSEQEKTESQGKMFARMRKDFNQNKKSLGIYAGTNAFYVATLKDIASMDIAGQMSAPAKGLDVNVLHLLVLDKAMGIGDEQLASQSNIEYIKGIGDAVDKSIAKVDSGEKQVVFFMNPTRIEQVRAVATTGEKMPQKSTFFYPKIFTGLVINKL